ncbi:MAG: F0F1 ATP synthase subunit A [Candidatus Nanopelagicales bacterium]|nr:F0F1 ATP synthase subunit A [Candidatus Nanopelagicales bacterium]
MSDLVSSTLASGGCHLYSGCGFPAPGTEIFEFNPIAQYKFLGVEFIINKPMLVVIMCAALVIIFFTVAFAKPRLIPGKVQGIGEMGYMFVRDQISRETIGREGDKFLPFLVSLFFFVFFMNVMGIVPGMQFPPTALFVMPVSLAIMVWLTYMFIGMRKQGPIKFFTNMMFPPGVPAPVLIILAPIEFLSNVIIRPFTLAIRLMANMFAGHLLLTVFIVASIYLFSFSVIGLLGSTASFLMTVIMTGFEFMIEALQAYIFTLLTASYIAGSLSHEH